MQVLQVGKYRVIDIDKVKDYILRRKKRAKVIYTKESLITLANRIYRVYSY